MGDGLIRHKWKPTKRLNEDGEELWECERCVTVLPGVMPGVEPLMESKSIPENAISPLPSEDCDTQVVRNVMQS
jgi:hypothetical protein